MGKSSAPSAPDPYQSAAAQYQYGTQAANYNMGLNAVNTVSPFSTTTWSENMNGVPLGGVGGTVGTGTTNPYAPNGGVGTSAGGGATAGNYPYANEWQNGGTAAGGASGPPQYTETTTLSPNEQALLTGQQTLGLGSQGAAGNELGAYEQSLAQNPMPTEQQNQVFGADAMQNAYNAETAQMNPYWSQSQEQLDASLRNSGATPGTPAYDNAMQAFQANRTAAYGQAENQAFGQGLNAEGQQIADIGQLQSAPLQQFETLASGVQAPSSTTTPNAPTSQVSAPNFMQALENQYQGQLANYNAGVASTNADVGAGATLGAALIGLAASDRGFKKDIKSLGVKTPKGNTLHEYRYNFQSKDSPKQVGVIAQDAEKHTPEAVFKDSQGMRYVDYARV